MNKNGEDQPAKASPTESELQRLASVKPRSDQDTKYQDDKGGGKDGVKQKEETGKNGEETK